MDVIVELLRAGADPYLGTTSPLHMACREGRANIVRAIVAETAVRLLHEAEASRASMGDFLSSHNAVSHVTSTTIPAGLSTEIKLTSEAALPEVVGGFTVERVTATSASVGVDQAELLQQLTDLLDQYAMTPLGLHCLLQIYLARAEGAK